MMKNKKVRIKIVHQLEKTTHTFLVVNPKRLTQEEVNNIELNQQSHPNYEGQNEMASFLKPSINPFLFHSIPYHVDSSAIRN